jgi:hypothetical protein
MERATARALSDAEMALATPAFSRAIAPDRLVIRYLDGSTTNSPRGAGLRLLERETVSTTRLLAALSTALDLTEGQLPGHALRTTFLAMGVADGMRMSEVDRATTSPSRAASPRSSDRRSRTRPSRSGICPRPNRSRSACGG